MIALDLGEISAFPFVDPPDARAVNDGLALLHELGALDGTALSPIGRALSTAARSTPASAACSSRPTAPAACARCS